MRAPIYQLDAFTTRRFAGNPAAVMPLDSFLADAMLQAIAAENNLAETAFIVADGGDYDFVSRYFAPAKGVAEDPVTGGAHCALAPYWEKRLNNTAFRAYQASPRGGEIICRLAHDRVALEGSSVFYMEGHAEI